MLIESNIIYNFEDLRALLLDNTKAGAFYLLLDDIYFEEITRNTMFTREVFTATKQVVKPINIIKYITFKVKRKYQINEVYESIDILRNNTNILVTIYNPRAREIVLLFTSNKDDSLLENHIRKLFEIEEIDYE
ncbi:MAG: hypothetical protein J6I85_00185 [Clostridia bacterium]|nr:hypothetical protein [Clostridia bacterium]MBP3800446.1 hypothetical protein [Clostridia bacterium]